MKSKKKPGRRSHRWAFPLGLLIFALAVVGAVSIGSRVVKKIENIANKTEQRAEYEKFLKPVVMNDPTPFDDIEQANMMELLDISLWALLEDDASPNNYEITTGENPGLIVPQTDVETEFAKLFGDKLKPIHTDITGDSYTFVYDSVNKQYIVPITGVMPAYTPSVVKIASKGSSIILTVGYVSGNDWAQDVQGNYVKPEPAKYMKITLRKDSGSYFIASIQATEVGEIVTGETKVPVTLPPEVNEVTVLETEPVSGIDETTEGETTEQEEPEDADERDREDD
ncbi:MAG: hypothetical protein K5756_01865 [Clostridiales bacterium]|nr:hypothetical protein [Clostridiales bacterium]